MDKLAVLNKRNQQLGLQLEEQRRESNELKERLAAHEAREAEYSQTLLCVKRLWEQLNSDVQHMCNLAGQDPLQAARYPAAAEASAGPLDGDDPFLGALLAGADEGVVARVQQAREELSEDTTAVEDALVAQSEATRRALSQLLGLIRGGANGFAGQAPPASALDAAAAEQRVLSEQCALYRDRLRASEARIKQMEEHAYDQQQDLSSANRKIAALQQTVSDLQQQQQQLQQQQQQLQEQQQQQQQQQQANAGGDAQQAQPTARGPPERAPSVPQLVNGDATEQQQGYEELTELLKKRTEDLDAEREAHMRTTRALRDMENQHAQHHIWVPQTAPYQALLADIASLKEQLQARQRDIESLGRERDQAEQHCANHNILTKSEKEAQGRVAEAQQRIQALMAAKVQADDARAEAEATLARERQKYEGSRTATELRTMMAVQQGQMDAKDKHIELAKDVARRMEQCEKDLAASKAEAAGARAEAELARRALSDIHSSSRDARKREEALKERVADMQAFVDVMSATPLDTDTHARELAAVKGQLAALTVRCEHLEARLQSQAEVDRSVVEEAQRLRQRLSDTETEVVSLRSDVAAARAHINGLSAQLQTVQETSKLFTQEIESTTKAYEEMQQQNQRLLGLLGQREDDASAMATEKAQMRREHTRLEKAREAARAETERVRADLASAVSVREASEREVARLATELSQLKDQLRTASWRVGSLEAEVKRREEAASALTAELEASQKSVATLRQEMADEQERFVREKNKRQRAEEDGKLANARQAKLKKVNSGALQPEQLNLQQEIDAMTKILTCSVCHNNPKNVAIVKCGHVFCNHCVDRMVTSRNRKCPGCGLVFAQSDIKPIFL